MEAGAAANAKSYSRYGTSTHKQLYIYGSLDTGPTELRRSFGMAWGIGGWLVFSFLGKQGPEINRRLRERVIAELKTTFASRYSHVVSLREALDVAAIRAYSRRATGEKYLIDPQKGAAA